MQRTRFFATTLISASGLLFLTALHCPISTVLSQASSSNRRLVCNAVFDMYFVLDSSGSVQNNYASNIVPFVKSVINRYTESGFRVAFVTFNTVATVQLQLTSIGDTNAVRVGLSKLENVRVGGGTSLSPALTEVNRMISIAIAASGSRNITSIILIVTDGGITDASSAQFQARTARARGSTIFAIGVGQYSLQQLESLTGSRDRVFTESNFNALHLLLDKVVKEICIEITPPNATVKNVSPMKYCRGRQTPNINISGSGFETLNRPTCHFWILTSGRLTSYDKQPVVTNNTLLCPTPPTDRYTGDIYLQVITRNGYNLTKNETTGTFVIEDCRRLYGVDPNRWCASQLVRKVNVSGRSLTDGFNNRAHCNYTLKSGKNHSTQYTYPVYVTDNEVHCPASSLILTGVIELRVSLNGVDYVPNSVFIQIDDNCTTVSNTMPLRYCRGHDTNITLSGSGFETLYRPNCRFSKPTGTPYYYDQQPLVNSNETIVCPTPDTGNYSGNLNLQVTTGTRYKKNGTMLFVEDCRRLSEAHPNQWCISETVEEVNISGTALTDGLDPLSVHCNYTLESGEEYTTYPVNVTDNKVRCPMESLNENLTLSGVVEVRVSLNGVDYVPNSVFIRINDCTRKMLNIALIAGVVGGFLGLLAFLACCCLLWCLLPLITCTVVGGVAKKEEEPVVVPASPPPPAPIPPPAVDVPRKPGRKWTIVDASYYGIRGAGGIRPAKVQWGNKGTTEEGAKLKRAKDAVKLGEVQVQGPPASPTRAQGSEMTSALLMEEDGGEGGKRKLCCCVLCCGLCYRRCCGVIINKLKGCYTVIASYRPVFKYHGTLGKRVLCCPGPNANENSKSTENGTTQTEPTNGRVSAQGSRPQPKWRLPQTNRSDVQEPLLLN